MVSETEYALMAGAVYISTRDQQNRIPLPAGTGWQVLGSPDVNPATGYEAQAYIRGDEIVISFAGTGTAVDWIANIQLAGGASTSQLESAALYYQSIKSTYGLDKTISFTGHSLGGGFPSDDAVMKLFYLTDRAAFLSWVM